MRADGGDRYHARQNRVAAHPQVVQAGPPPGRRKRLTQAMQRQLRVTKGLLGRTGPTATTSPRARAAGNAATAKGFEVCVIEPDLQHSGVRVPQAMQ